MATATLVVPDIGVGSECKFTPVNGSEGDLLEMCWCKERCFIGQGAYGNVYKGKCKQDEATDVAVKVPTGPYHVEYEIASLKKANGHRNILRFYEEIEVKSPPSRYEHPPDAHLLMSL